MPNNDPKYKPKISPKVLIDYVPHGIDHQTFKKLSLEFPGETITRKIKKQDKETEIQISEFEDMLDFKKRLLNEQEYEFIILFNNRNIRRKMPGDIILAFKEFTKIEISAKQKSEQIEKLMKEYNWDDVAEETFEVYKTVHSV